MTIADELRKLQELHASGSLNDQEFAAAKAAVLAKDAAFGAGEGLEAIPARIKKVELQTELKRLDREWGEACERFKFDAGGIRFHVSRGASVALGLGGVLLGLSIAWFIAFGPGSSVRNHPPFLWVWGPVMALPLVVLSVWLYRVAGRLEEARRRYEERRAALIKEGRDAERG